ncbi:MAG TPA: hypothetical protein P5136_07980 [Methanofastidiosum sp.]|nr:hypothetical protein [Methanofastidiosum sp.]
MNNQKFLEIIKESFDKYLHTSSRSNEKLKILHGAIARDIKNKLGTEYTVHSLGIFDSKEKRIGGRYMEKTVDIAIEHDEKIVGGVGLKFIMSNYSQNSNNYFENMLGETANIRCANIPYFQIIIFPSRVPYFKDDGSISKYEEITPHNLSKYLNLSTDDAHVYMHIPNKILLYLVNIDIPRTNPMGDKKSYYEFYTQNNRNYMIRESTEIYNFGNSIIYNDYERFIEEICQIIVTSNIFSN